MPFIDYATCEPLRVWNRLEPRTRKVEFDAALTASVHDPMWMLARQWQLGEFKGEDTGSAVFATLARRVTPVGAVAVGSGPPEAEDLSLPVEARVERLPAPFPPLVRAQAGRRFLATMAETAAEQPPATPFVLADHRGWFAAAFPIPAPAVPDEEDLAGRARARADARSRRVAAALAGRAVDGVELFAALVPGMTLAQLPAPLVAKLPPDHGPLVLAALERFRAWFAALYPADAGADAWDPAAARVPRRLHGAARRRERGHADRRRARHGQARLARVRPRGSAAVRGAGSQTDVRTVLPAPVEFAGMPRPRWWEFEDAAVDLGHFRAQAPPTSRRSWSPSSRCSTATTGSSSPTGSRSGRWPRSRASSSPTRSAPHVRHRRGAQLGRPLDRLGPLQPVAARYRRRRRPAATAPVHSRDGRPASPRASRTSPSRCVRDESANMVWAVERRIPDGMGGSRDGTTAARRFSRRPGRSGRWRRGRLRSRERP